MSQQANTWRPRGTTGSKWAATRKLLADHNLQLSQSFVFMSKFLRQYEIKPDSWHAAALHGHSLGKNLLHHRTREMGPQRNATFYRLTNFWNKRQHNNVGGGEDRAIWTPGSTSPKPQQQAKMDLSQPPRHVADPNSCLPDFFYQWASTDSARLKTKHQVPEASKAESWHQH
jgi:hypothetical protein